MIDQATAERAWTLCVTAEPHDTLGCRPGHLMEARRQLSAFASSVIGGSAAAGALDGAAERVPGASPADGQPAASTSTSRTRGAHPGPAGNGTAVRPQEGA